MWLVRIKRGRSPVHMFTGSMSLFICCFATTFYFIVFYTLVLIGFVMLAAVCDCGDSI